MLLILFFFFQNSLYSSLSFFSSPSSILYAHTRRRNEVEEPNTKADNVLCLLQHLSLPIIPPVPPPLISNCHGRCAYFHPPCQPNPNTLKFENDNDKDAQVDCRQNDIGWRILRRGKSGESLGIKKSCCTGIKRLMKLISKRH